MERAVRSPGMKPRRLPVSIAMALPAVTAGFVVVAMPLDVPAAHAGPCSASLAQFEQTMRQTAGDPDAGPMARQTIGAQLGHQPTPASVKRAEQEAKAGFEVYLARAKRLNARGRRSCMRALAAAEQRYIP